MSHGTILKGTSQKVGAEASEVFCVIYQSVSADKATRSFRPSISSGEAPTLGAAVNIVLKMGDGLPKSGTLTATQVPGSSNAWTVELKAEAVEGAAPVNGADKPQKASARA